MVEEIKLELESEDLDFFYEEFKKRFKKELGNIPADTEIEEWFKEAIWISYKIWIEILKEIFKPKLEIKLETGVMIPEECIKKCSKKLEDKYIDEFFKLVPEIINVDGTIIKRGDIKKEIEKEFYERKIVEEKIEKEIWKITKSEYFEMPDEIIIYQEGEQTIVKKNTELFNNITYITDKRFERDCGLKELWVNEEMITDIKNKLAIEFIYTEEKRSVYKCNELSWEKEYSKILFPLPHGIAIFGDIKQYQPYPMHLSIHPEVDCLIPILEERVNK